MLHSAETVLESEQVNEVTMIGLKDSLVMVVCYTNHLNCLEIFPVYESLSFQRYCMLTNTD